jgi:hypothetical protein
MTGESKHTEKAPPPDESQRPKAPETKDATEARTAGAAAMSAVERRRTNRSAGSLSEEQNSSVEIEFGDGTTASRRNQISEKQAIAGQSEATISKGIIPPPHPVNPRPHDAARPPSQMLGDFAQAAVKRATDPHGQHVYIQEQIDKFIGVGEGLNMAKEQTKSSAVSAWTALNDGTVAKFLATPNAFNDPLYKLVGSTLDAMAKDPQAVNKALTHLGDELMKASNNYTAMSPKEKGHVIGQTMFGMVNPEGSTEGGEALLKVADKVATHVDAAVTKGIEKSYEAAQQLAKTSPAMAAQAKQMLLDYTKTLGLTPQEMELAGIPRGYFDGMPADADGHRATNVLERGRPKDAAGASGFREGGATKSAVAILKKAGVAEKYVTPDLQTLADQTGGEMVGLECRLKSVDSLTRKIKDGVPAAEIKDALRYTMTFPAEDLTGNLKEVVRELESQGHKPFKVKNTFGTGDIYRGVNCGFETVNGQKFELQFHTPQSFHVKEHLNHQMYEVARELVKTDEVTHTEVLRNRHELLKVGHKYQDTLPEYPHLNDLVRNLAEAKDGVADHAQTLKDALTAQMKANYVGCEDPPDIKSVQSFSKEVNEK